MFTTRLFEFAGSAGILPASYSFIIGENPRPETGAPGGTDKLKLELQPRRFNLPA